MTAPRTAESIQRSRFEQYVLPEVDFVLRLSRRMANPPSDAEDLAQDVLLRAFRGIGGFDGTKPRAWLAQIVRNTAITRGRRRPPEDAWAEMEWTTHADASVGCAAVDEPEAALERDLDPLMRRALSDLSSRHRAVVALVDIDGFRYDEAAAVLGVPVGTVMSRLHRARRRLRHALAGSHLDGPPVPPPALAA